jgi:hypothetical protein
LVAAHGKTRNGPVRPVRQDAVMRLGIRHDVGHEFLQELVGLVRTGLLLLDSLVDGFRGSMTAMLSTLKSIGPTVTDHTPFSPLVIEPGGGPADLGH